MKTKKIIATIVLTSCFCATGFAQMRHPMMRQHPPRMMRPMRAPAVERIHAIKVAYITDKLHFTSDQSAKFWPIYDRYEDDVQTTRRQFMEKYAKTNPGQADDMTSRQFIDDNFDYQQEVLNIRRKYNDEFLKVLTPQQAAELYKTEREFKRLLIQQLKERQGNRNYDNNTQDALPTDK